MIASKQQIEERILGYDARESWLAMPVNWTEKRKKDYLYRLDVFKPLSVDTLVWPNIFEQDSRQVRSEQFNFQKTWSSLLDLQNAVAWAVQKNQARAWCTIAITLLLNLSDQDNRAPLPSHSPLICPDHCNADWVLLGYDVADQYMLSGLSNCGFLPQEDDIQHLRDCWAKYLNKFHLFDDEKRATEFRYFSNDHVKEHAPFFVFGLWLIEAVGVDELTES